MQNNDNHFHFWQKWLTYAKVMTIGVGLLVAFAGNSIFFEVHNDFTKDVFFHGNEFDSYTLAFKNWLFGIIGGTIVGFHVLMVMISEYSYKKKETSACNAIWFGLISWFIIDIGRSLYYGAIHNVILINLAALVLIGIPLVMTRKYFKKTPHNHQTISNV